MLAAGDETALTVLTVGSVALVSALLCDSHPSLYTSTVSNGVGGGDVMERVRVWKQTVVGSEMVRFAGGVGRGVVTRCLTAGNLTLRGVVRSTLGWLTAACLLSDELDA